jgi:hypothetical protein
MRKTFRKSAPTRLDVQRALALWQALHGPAPAAECDNGHGGVAEVDTTKNNATGDQCTAAALADATDGWV